MSGNKIKVVISESVKNDLKKAFKKHKDVAEGFADLVKKLIAMTLEEAKADKGINLEKMLSRKKDGIWTMRINRDWRVICKIESGPAIVVIGALDHNATYR